MSKTLRLNKPKGLDTTDKLCPGCGNTHLVLLHTQNKKMCSDCGTVFDWNLDPRP